MIYPILTAGVFVLDSAVKHFADKRLAEHTKHPRFFGLLTLEKYYNQGAAFGFLSGHPAALRGLQTVLFASVGTAYALLLRLPGKPVAKTGMALLTGGGASNFLDRCIRGYVVDYFHLNIGPKRFRRIIYNISDICIFLGAVLTVFGADE